MHHFVDKNFKVSSKKIYKNRAVFPALKKHIFFQEPETDTTFSIISLRLILFVIMYKQLFDVFVYFNNEF